MTRQTDLIVARPEGVYRPQGDFHIDPWQPVERAVITHARGRLLCILAIGVKIMSRAIPRLRLRENMAGVRQFNEDDAFVQALDVFWRKGYRATSMLDLAEATGVQRGSLYNAYGDKEEIFMRVFERYAERFVADARKALDKPDPHDALTSFFTFAIRSITQGSPTRGCLSTKTAVEIEPESPRLREALRTMLDALEAALLAVLDTKEARAQLTMPPQQAASLIVTTTRGIAVMERIYGDPKKLRQTAFALVDALVRKH
ncbi:DNA ligase, ATP-dependent, PP_1105 family (fragment) [Paraburkholderia piptadeniae]|uniref:DNA ligase, ATP-dependent, PP_1105 family n=2 Tax=Paraburkholderia piptadeniae TaxID=1701573 RepID=A0A1N7SVC1_9BURK